MANADAAFGAIPIKHLDGSPYNGMVNEYYIAAATDANVMAIGDLVIHGGDADADGVPLAVQATAGATSILGSIVGFRPDNTNANLTHRAASTLRYFLVADGPDLVYRMQEDSDGAALVVGDVGKNCDIIVAAADSTIGVSRMEIDSSTNVTSAANVRILRLYRDGVNVTGNQAVWEVMINEHFYKTTSGV